eukprot:scaffold123263_cov30-Cyclotella_meneghiniana.AAC.1
MSSPATATDATSSSNIASVSLHRPKELLTIARRTPLRLYHLLFLLLYLHQTHWVISTIGHPYRAFLEKAEREGFQVMEGTAKLRAELTHALSDVNDPHRHTKDKPGWFDWMDMDIEEAAALKKRRMEKSVLDALPKSMRVPKRFGVSSLT